MAKWGGYKLNIYSPRGLQDLSFEQSRASFNLCAIKRGNMPTRKVNFGLDSELVGRINCTMLYNNLSRMIFFCQDVLRLNTLYTVTKKIFMWTFGKKLSLITKGAEAGKALSFSPLVRACTLEIFPIGTKKFGASYVCYTAVFSVVVLLPGALRDDTKRLCSRLLVLSK